MARSLRIQGHTASHYASSRGNKRRAAIKSEADRLKCLSYWQPSTFDDNAAIRAYPLMAKHHYLPICKPSGNLPQITKHINCACATYLYLKRDRFPGTYPRGAIKPSRLQMMPTD